MDVVTRASDRLAKPSCMGRSDHLEIALIVQDVPGPILPLRNKLPDFLDERGVLVVTPINGHIFGQPRRKSSEAVRRLCLQVPRDMDERATFLVPDRGLDSRSYPLVVEVLDGMPSSVWPLFQVVVDDVGPDDDRFEDPAVGLMPAQSCTKDASEHVNSFLRS